MLEPISRGQANRRMKALRRRLAWLDDKLAGAHDPRTVSYTITERAALQWAIDELVALYAEHEQTRPQGKRP